MKTFVETVSELDVYRSAFGLQQRIFELTKAWPGEERYSLIDQVRRASRSVGANIAEAWAKRRYEAHFVSKLTDADAELAETRHWLRTAHACAYLDSREVEELQSKADSIGRMLGKMIAESGRWVLEDSAIPQTAPPDGR